MVKKIDFHIHTISTEKDYDFSYSAEWIKDYVNEAKLDAIAITNHDLFDEENFHRVEDDVPKVAVFPGMELSLEDGHVNIIFPREEIPNLIIFSKWIQSQNLGEKGKISVEDYCANMKNWEKGIYVFELGKSNSLPVPEKLKNVCYVGGVSNQLKFQIFDSQDNDIKPVLFSDAHADYDDREEYRRDIKSLKNKNTYLQIDECSFSEIRNALKHKDKIHINSDALHNVIDIDGHRVSTGLNLIVGKRGTGKTNFLERIKKQYDSDDIYEIAQFETSKSEEYIETQRKVQGENAVKLWKERYSTQFKAIENYLEFSDTVHESKIDNYLESVKQFANDMNANKSSSKYQLAKEVSFENISIEYIEKHLHTLNNLINSEDLWGLLSDSQQKKNIFISTYNELLEIYTKKYVESKIKNKSNEIIQEIKEIVQSKTGITPTLNIELAGIIEKVRMEKEITSFMEELVIDTDLSREDIYGYQIIVKLSPFKKASQFQRDFNTNEAVENDLIKPYKNGNFIKFLQNLKNKKFFKYPQLADYLLHTEVELLDSDGTPASGGQAVGFSLVMRLEEAKNKPIVLIDEPEASLDNAYIRKELINSLKSLSRRSTVFVVTHNSTLGTLIEPDYLIVTTKNENKEYSILTGEFSSKTISENSEKAEQSYEKFVEAMEAGIETYNKKGVIYESLRNQ